MEKTIRNEEEEKDKNKLQVKSRNYNNSSHNPNHDQLLVRLGSADMPPTMQDHALRCTSSLLHLHHTTTSSPKPSLLALALKKEFDSVYGPVRHCIVGKSFRSFVTHVSSTSLSTILTISLSFSSRQRSNSSLKQPRESSIHHI